MKNVMEPLLALQTIELGAARETPENAAEIARLRQIVPAQILGHYDRLMARGKKGVAMVRNGVCAECHMRLSSGNHSQLLRAEDVMLCESCGRYLWAEPAAAPTAEAAADLAAKKPHRRSRKKEAATTETAATTF